jgi:hypothetical protein
MRLLHSLIAATVLAAKSGSQPIEQAAGVVVGTPPW